VVLHPPGTAEDQLPRLAIRPYPARYAGEWTMDDGQKVAIRPIRPEDEPLMVKFHQTLSDRTVYMRYLHTLPLSQRIAHERLTRICFIDYDREMALVAERRDPETDQSEIIGVGRLKKAHGANEAEFAVLVADAHQGKGLGAELTRRLIQVAADEKLERLVGDILPDNLVMLRLCERLGFKLTRSIEDPVVKAQYELSMTA